LLAELFQAALKVSGVSVDDNFFDLGGHSLLCFQVIAQVQERTGVRLNPRVMMMNTLEQTAMLIEQEHGSSTNHPSVQIDVSDKHSPAKAAGFAKKMLQRLGL
jgi:acyl carrier protein